MIGAGVAAFIVIVYGLASLLWSKRAAVDETAQTVQATIPQQQTDQSDAAPQLAPIVPSNSAMPARPESATSPASYRGVICIDPGHPSEVGRGTEGKRISEITAVWQVGLKLQSELQARGYSVVMTKRSEYEFVRNKRRAEIANNCHADLMIRLHCDANAGSGIAAYAPDRQGTSGGYKGPSATVIDESQKLARPFFDALVGRLRGKLASRGLHPDIATAVGRKQGALTGSIYSEVPVVLVEICVLTNPKDEDFVVSVDGQKQIADALADGVDAAIAARRTSSEPPTVK